MSLCGTGRGTYVKEYAVTEIPGTYEGQGRCTVYIFAIIQLHVQYPQWSTNDEGNKNNITLYSAIVHV